MTLDQLYDEYESKLYGFALRLTKNADRADDLVQDTLVRCMGHLELLALLVPAQRQAWLFRTLKNLFFDEEIRTRRQTTYLEGLVQESLISDSSPEVMLVDPFDHIPDRFRDVVEMHYRWGMSSQEIAAQLEIPAATVRSRLHLAIKEMRRKQHQLE